MLRHQGRPGSGGLVRDSGSFLSVSTFHLPDEERSAKSLLHSQALLLALYLLSWGMAALAVTNPMTVEQVTKICLVIVVFLKLKYAQ